MTGHWCYEHGADARCNCFKDFMQSFMAVRDTHTDADLAMALELADVIMGESFATNGPCGAGAECYVCVPHWLRTEVRNALLERAL